MFYKEGLLRFDDQAFADAGFEPWVRNRFEQIVTHEEAQTARTLSALGSDGVPPCTYDL